MALVLENYSEKAIVVYGPGTKECKEQLKELGGKFNANLRTGPGWIYSKQNEKKVREFVEMYGTLVPEKNVEKKASAVIANAGSVSQVVETVRQMTQKFGARDKQQLLWEISLCLTKETKEAKEVPKESPKESPKEVVDIVVEDDEDDDSPPPKSLLRKTRA
jgi:hypothetical protein